MVVEAGAGISMLPVLGSNVWAGIPSMLTTSAPMTVQLNTSLFVWPPMIAPGLATKDSITGGAPWTATTMDCSTAPTRLVARSVKMVLASGLNVCKPLEATGFSTGATNSTFSEFVTSQATMTESPLATLAGVAEKTLMTGLVKQNGSGGE